MKGQGINKKSWKKWSRRVTLGLSNAKKAAQSTENIPRHHRHHFRKKSEKPLRYPQLFRYTSKKDRFGLLFAIVCCMIIATGFPILNVLAANVSLLMVEGARGKLVCNRTSGTPVFQQNPVSADVLYERLVLYSILMTACGLLQFLGGYLSISIFNRIAKKQTYQIRIHYFTALLRQNIGWYDTRKNKSFTCHMEEDVRKVEQSIGEKLGLFIYYLCTSIFCLVIAVGYGWKLTLFIIAPYPLMAGLVFALESFQSTLTLKEQGYHSLAGEIAQEVIVNIKTVYAFSGQGKEMLRYGGCLDEAARYSRKRGLAASIGISLAWFFNFISYSIVIWYGSRLIIEDWKEVCEGQRSFRIDNLIAIVFNVLDVEFNVAQCVILMQIITQGRGAAAAIYSVIDRESEIDSLSRGGLQPEEPLLGKIEFIDVKFAYPARPRMPILDGVNVVIQPGMVVAVIGESGCGKSTCLHLLERFYDPSEGMIAVDGVDIREYNIKWYRSQVAVVNQEPILFNTTIAENVRYGCQTATQEEIENACILSNAHSFIVALPNKYDTIVGNRGSQLSGGQKQRLALARAFVQNAPIMLLDEVTSALDYKNEYLIHRAIFGEARHGKTIFLVTHSLQSVKAADLIIIIKDGQVLDAGSPKALGQKFQAYTDEEEVNQDFLDSYGVDNVDLQDSTTIMNSSESEITLHRLVMLHTPPPTPPFIERQKKEYSRQIRLLSGIKSIIKIIWMNRRDWPLMFIGVLMSIAHGFVLPLTAYLFDEGYELFFNSYNLDADSAEHHANYLVTKVIILGSVSAVAIFFGLLCFCVTGDRTANRLRKTVFAALMKQELAWFQKPENNVGALCSRLSEDAAIIHEATGSQMETFIQTLTTIVISVGFSFYIQPTLAAVAVIFVPVILVASFWNGKMVENQESDAKILHEQASNIGYQAVSNIRSVASLCLEDLFIENFTRELMKSYRKSLKQAHILGIVFGLSQGIMCIAYAGILFYGSYLVQEGGINFAVVFTTGELLIWTMLETGQTLAYLPSYNRAKVAAGRMFIIINRQSPMQKEHQGQEIDNCNGKLEFENVDFSYSNRPSFKVLENLTWDAEPNSNVAIIGPSGSGKSTVIEMILRYYDPTSGAVLLDDTDIRAINIDSVRAQMAIVSQEPGLFDLTIAENIAYGDNSREVTMEEIEAAAACALAHDFIVKLPEGYSTRVGDRGTQLSGGQKQRLAIARALVRNPRILLLDEATSALDRRNENNVQQALDFAETERTCIKIAHHLYHIKNADKIVVVNAGKVAEQGTHDELLQNRGIYWKLWSIQEGDAGVRGVAKLHTQ
ncbi:unnamed protein product [Allacma fusca]|uniref:ABC-type xenobiotic transporter n=1 Tax=Allacma fusca TaxID=39272 RepID=A0A8J2JLA8_9HEXA|nr:unnamed protein product [Allacma fusca]